jgi:hypothetical protein
MFIDAILEDFPWWHDLNAIWRELPKYNVLTTSNSTADGQELVANLDGVLSSLSEKGEAVVEGNSEDNAQLLVCILTMIISIYSYISYRTCLLTPVLPPHLHWGHRHHHPRHSCYSLI